MHENLDSDQIKYQLELHDVRTVLRLGAGLHSGGAVVVVVTHECIVVEISHLRRSLGFLSGYRVLDTPIHGGDRTRWTIVDRYWWW